MDFNPIISFPNNHYQRFSLYKIKGYDALPFSAKEYSQFKFGNTDLARKFGVELAKAFIDEYAFELLEQKKIILLPSPYLSVPTASNYLTSFFKKELNLFLYKQGKDTVYEGKIHRKYSYTVDYGELDFRDRLNLISKDTYQLDNAFIQDQYCIFIDDVRITGSHEYIIQKSLQENRLRGNFRFVYFAELTNENIPATIENYLNYFYVQSVHEIIEIVQHSSFQFNTRIIKKILSYPHSQMEEILSVMSHKQKEALLNLAISNNYHKISEFQDKIQWLYSLFFERGAY